VPRSGDDQDQLASVGRQRLRVVTAALAAMVRVDAIWLATEPLDM
jgi:hypothetical protein